MPEKNLPPVRLDVTDPSRLQEYGDDIIVGHYFVFARRAGAVQFGTDRSSRLGLRPAPTDRAVLPMDGELQVAGVTLNRKEKLEFSPLGCVVSDRDLYRAEEDVVNLFVALPAGPKNAMLEIDADGAPFTSRELDVDDGVVIETLAMLLPGEYEARLVVDGHRVGEPVRFTVAQYTLAPLSGRLVSHELDRGENRLAFVIEVESYQVPLDEDLQVQLLDREIPQSSIIAEPTSAGRFRGELTLRGEGPFRLRVAPESDPGRTAEIVIPGTRAHERELTLLNEFGTEKLFSMMPEPGAIPLRGGYVSEGDAMATPLMVDEIVTDSPKVEIRGDVTNLHATIIDQVTGAVRVESFGDVAAGEAVELDIDTALCTVIFGCWYGDRPLEGYTTFIRPTAINLDLEVPETAAPREDLKIKISVDTADQGEVPVLVCVRDERLTASDTPEVALASSWKSSVDEVVSSMAESGFSVLRDLIPLRPPANYSSGGWQGSSGWSGSSPQPRASAPRQRSRQDTVEMSAIDSAVSYEDSSSFGESRPQGAARGGAMLQSPASAPADGFGGAPKGGAGGAPPAPAPRSQFAEVLFYGLIHVDGEYDLILPLPDSLGTFVVEAFALSEADWAQTRTELVVDQQVRVDLEVPASVHPEDDALGRLRVATISGRARAKLFHDGEEVALEGAGDGIWSTPVELPFPVGPGEWEARVEDADSGESDSVVHFVDSPGTYRRQVKALRLLRQGESLDLDSADALTLRVLPGLESSFDSLIEASAGYSHLCCEQTAAKMLSATFMYLTAKDDRTRDKAEKIIIAGAEREKQMVLPGRKFEMYPGYGMVSEHYSQLTVRYLWGLRRLESMDELSSSLRRAVSDALEMADAAAQAHGMDSVPSRINSMEEAYATVSNGGNRERAATYVEENLDSSGDGIGLKMSTHRVNERAELAYAAATLTALGRLDQAIPTADQVTRQFNEEGRLYSTVDSIGAIALMLELKACGVADGTGGTVRINGSEYTPLEAAGLSDQVETIEVVDGVTAVEVTRIVEERWDAFEGSFPVRVGFRDESDRRAKKFQPGHRYELYVELKEGYRNGDLVHVALPPCMAWLRGGGRVQSFTVDFEGKDELRVPVIVTADFEGKQHFAACVRNMFEEERASSPGLLEVKNKSGWFG